MSLQWKSIDWKYDVKTPNLMYAHNEGGLHFNYKLPLLQQLARLPRKIRLKIRSKVIKEVKHFGYQPYDMYGIAVILGAAINQIGGVDVCW